MVQSSWHCFCGSSAGIYIIKRVMSVCLSVCLSVCMYVANGRPNSWADKTKLGIGTHVDPRSVLVKVKVIYLCVWYNRINACDTWRITMNHAHISSSSSGSGSAVAGATW